MRRLLIGIVAAAVLLGGVDQRRARGDSDRREAEGETAVDAEQNPAAMLGWGMAAIGTNLGYIPAKILYALAGGLTGLLAWGVTAGNDEVAKGILNPAFGGTWVVTPEMLQGKEPVLFNGPSYDPER